MKKLLQPKDDIQQLAEDLGANELRDFLNRPIIDAEVIDGVVIVAPAKKGPSPEVLMRGWEAMIAWENAQKKGK